MCWGLIYKMPPKLINRHHRFLCSLTDGIFEGDFSPVAGFLSIVAVCVLQFGFGSRWGLVGGLKTALWRRLPSFWGILYIIPKLYPMGNHRSTGILSRLHKYLILSGVRRSSLRFE